MSLTLHTFIVGLLTLLPALASHAEEEIEPPNWYTVELVLFSQGNAAAMESEQWPNDPGMPDIHGAVELFESHDDPVAVAELPEISKPETLRPPTPPIAFGRLTADELELGEAVKKLNRHAGYQTLLHLGWRQPGLPREQAPAVHLNTRPFSAVAPNMTEAQKPTPTLFSAIPFLRASEPTPEVEQGPGIEGSIRLYLRRYLHLEADLLYENKALIAETDVPQSTGAKLESSPFVAQQAPVFRFRLQQQRRLRSGELHYLDHPLFGLMVKVTPFELPPEPEPIPEELNNVPTSDLSVSPQEAQTKQP